ncbi:hypothetical protein ACP70R_029105 [Stipagrostis hirtigluma subsp. patula]
MASCSSPSTCRPIAAPLGTTASAETLAMALLRLLLAFPSVVSHLTEVAAPAAGCVEGSSLARFSAAQRILQPHLGGHFEVSKLYLPQDFVSARWWLARSAINGGWAVAVSERWQELADVYEVIVLQLVEGFVAVVFTVGLTVDKFHADIASIVLKDESSNEAQATGIAVDPGHPRLLHRAYDNKYTAGLPQPQIFHGTASCRLSFPTGADEAHHMPAGVHKIKNFLTSTAIDTRGFSLHSQPPLSVLEQWRPFRQDALTGVVQPHRRYAEEPWNFSGTDRPHLHVAGMQSFYSTHVI